MKSRFRMLPPLLCTMTLPILALSILTSSKTLLAASPWHGATEEPAKTARETPATGIVAQPETAPLDLEIEALPDAPEAQSSSASNPAPGNPQMDTQKSGPKQTKRILWIVPNFRSVSADEKLPPISTHDKFKIVLDDTFDYSAFIEVGMVAGVADIHKSEPEFRHGAAAYGRYYWHAFADNTDGNLMTEFLLPVATHEDPRYYTLGHGGFLRQATYSVTRLLITRNDSGHATPNFSEIVGNGAASGISNFYYPENDRTWTKTGQRWAQQVGIDGLSNLVKEFWPNLNEKLFHDKY